MKPNILITGATGTTSQYAIDALLSKGVSIRAMVRTIDSRSDTLEQKGVEIIKGDFSDYKSLEKALEGIERAYFCYPFIDHLPKAATLFAKVAKQKGVKQVVAISQMNIDIDTTSPATLNHLLAQDIFNWAEVGAVHIRPALFAWNYLTMAAPSVVSDRKFYFPASQSNYSIVHPKDIGEAVAAILTDVDIKKHDKKEYILTGDRTYSHTELADVFGSLVGEKIDYLPIPVDHWLSVMESVPEVNDFLLTHLRELAKDIDQGKFNAVSEATEFLTGNKPRSFESYLEEHKEFFIPKVEQS